MYVRGMPEFLCDQRNDKQRCLLYVDIQQGEQWFRKQQKKGIYGITLN